MVLVIWLGKTVLVISAGVVLTGHLLLLPKAAMAQLFRLLQWSLFLQPLLQHLPQHRLPRPLLQLFQLSLQPKSLMLLTHSLTSTSPP